MKYATEPIGTYAYAFIPTSHSRLTPIVNVSFRLTSIHIHDPAYILSWNIFLLSTICIYELEYDIPVTLWHLTSSWFVAIRARGYILIV